MEMNNFEIVKKAIDEWDPYGLLKIGCPSDECDNETKNIERKINCKNSIQDIACIISKVFSSSFNEPNIFSIESCIGIAEKIKKLIR